MVAGLAEGNAAQQGGASGLGTTQSLWDALDPGNLTGHSSSSVLGNILDPGNVLGLNPQLKSMGPGSATAGTAADSAGVPSTLPTLPGVGAPRLYNPNSFGGLANLGTGSFNKMAAQLAGPQYRPTLMGSGASTGNPASAPGGKGGAAAPAINGKGAGQGLSGLIQQPRTGSSVMPVRPLNMSGGR
jgi:hypothetical protein